ncbi:hypothetical protein ANO14919_138260 [Xylariales sp. No.14919]|nr:hypothetical protein ANO14919_138260 [Xylariales sp. No.14919]
MPSIPSTGTYAQADSGAEASHQFADIIYTTSQPNTIYTLCAVLNAF